MALSGALRPTSPAVDSRVVEASTTVGDSRLMASAMPLGAVVMLVAGTLALARRLLPAVAGNCLIKRPQNVGS